MEHTDIDEERPTGQSLRRGFLRRCPNCGEGALLKGYLSVHDHCNSCGEALHHQRADDGPAYLTILVVGHLLAPIMLYVFVAFRPSPLTMIVGFTIGVCALSLYLLPRFKGAMIAFQWARRMHGFDESSS